MLERARGDETGGAADGLAAGGGKKRAPWPVNPTMIDRCSGGVFLFAGASSSRRWSAAEASVPERARYGSGVAFTTSIRPQWSGPSRPRSDLCCRVALNSFFARVPHVLR